MPMLVLVTYKHCILCKTRAVVHTKKAVSHKTKWNFAVVTGNCNFLSSLAVAPLAALKLHYIKTTFTINTVIKHAKILL